MTTIAISSPIHTRNTRRSREHYADLLERLSELSVTKYHDPFIDIDWDAPEHAIHADDARHCIADDHPLASSEWYASLNHAERARFGLALTLQQLKYGVTFEAVLSRGLLEFCQTVPDGSLEFRYAMHEVIEEARHTHMFQEFINRCQLVTATPLQTVRGFDARMDDMVARWGRTFPERFFFSVLSGELFIDAQNRELLRAQRASVHPLLRRIVQIHVTEEARHVCFAERFLDEHLPMLSAPARWHLQYTLPISFAKAAQMMLEPPPALCARFGIPKATLRNAYGRGSEYRRGLGHIVQPVRELCARHGLRSALSDYSWQRCGFEFATEAP
jgi:hypothetical protein